MPDKTQRATRPKENWTCKRRRLDTWEARNRRLLKHICQQKRRSFTRPLVPRWRRDGRWIREASFRRIPHFASRAAS